MSLAVAHFTFGATLTTVLVLLVVPATWYPRTLTLVGGGWAMLPDAYLVVPVATEQLFEFHQTSVLTDLFWFHRTLDRLDPADSIQVSALCIAVFILVTLFAEWRGYRSPRQVRAAHEQYLGVGDSK